MKKSSKISCIYIYIYPLSLQECQDTKLILAPLFTMGKARVTQYGFLLQVSSKSAAKDTINSMHLHFSKNKFTFPVGLESFNMCWETFISNNLTLIIII